MPKELYMASSIEELVGKGLKIDTSVNATRLVKSATKVYEAAYLADREQDEEKAFTMYMRFYDIVMKVRGSKEYKGQKSYYDTMLNIKNTKEAIVRCEALKDSLSKRYNLRKEAKEREQEEKNCKEENSLKLNGKTSGIIKPLSNGVPQEKDGLITSSSLNALMKERSTQFLVVDIRPENHFKSSRLKTAHCINIPEKILTRGKTAAQIGELLDYEAKLLWDRRGRVDKLIIVDWGTEGKPFPDPVSVLLESMQKWDPGTTYNSVSLVLQGGFELWLLSYPLATTNPKAEIPSIVSSRLTETSSVSHSSLLDFSYPDLDSGFLASPTNPDTSTPLQPEPVRIIPKDATDSNTNSNIYKKTTDSNSNIYKKTTDSNIKYPQVPNLPALHNGSIAPKKIPPTSSSSSGGSAPPSVDRKSKPAGENSSQEVNGINGILPSPSHTINNNNNNNVIPTVPSRSLKPRELLDGFKGAMAKEEKLMEDTMELEKKEMFVLAQLEQAKSSAQMEDLQSQISSLHKDRRLTEERLNRISQENEDLWRALRSVLSGKENGLPADRLPAASTRATDQAACDELSSHQQHHEELRRKVESMRRERKEKERRLKEKQEMEEKERKRQQRDARNSSSNSGVSGGGLSYNTALKPPKRGGSPDRPSSNLRRSHSAFNLSQLEDSLDSSPASNTRSAGKPSFDRNIKPLPSRMTVNLARHRDFGPMGGYHPRTGLKNLGNTCYQNAVIQCLNSIHHFSHYFETEKHYHQLNQASPSKGEVAEEFGAVIKALRSQKHKTMAVRDFKQVVGKYCREFRGTDHHDAHEFLLKLSDWLHDDLNIGKNPRLPLPEQNHSVGTPDYIAAKEVQKIFEIRDHSIVRKLFYGLHRNVVTCTVCRARSLTFEPFFALSLSIPTNGRSHLPDLLDSYYKESRIPYNCEKCSRNKEGIRKMDIWEGPQVLVIHLNRFEQQTMNMATKNPNMVDFPLKDLNLSRLVVGKDNGSCYALRGVCNHYGTMDGGHYTAMINNGSHWLKCDDHEVYEMSSSKVKTSAAYVLFYELV